MSRHIFIKNGNIPAAFTHVSADYSLIYAIPCDVSHRLSVLLIHKTRKVNRYTVEGRGGGDRYFEIQSELCIDALV